MAVNEDLSAYSTTAASNTPAGSSNIGPDLDNHLRDIKRNIRRVAERYQGATTPEAFRGRDWLDTSGTASNKLELTMNDGTNEVPYIQLDTSAGTSTPLVHGTPIPTGSMAVQSASSVAITGGAIDGTTVGGTTPAAGDFTDLEATSSITLDTDASSIFTATTQSSGAAGHSPYLIMKRARGTKASPSAVLASDTLGRLLVRPYDDAGFTVSNLGEIKFTATENHTATNHGTEMSVLTTPKGSETPAVTFTAKDDQTVEFTAGLMLQSGQTLLDQYDEGTFSVGVDDGAGNSATLSSSCAYTRIGNEVSFRIGITLSSKGAMTSGNAVRITGMPFTAASSDDGGVINYAESLSLGANVALTYRHSGTTLSLWKWDTSGGPTSFKVSNLTDSTALSISGKYFV